MQGQNGFSSLSLVISIGKILPKDSLVFTIVKRGDVDELKSLLTRRQCTLRDRDTYGTPLLHYAMLQPEMCKFLVKNGADVDEVACTTSNQDFSRFVPRPPLFEHGFDYLEDDDHKLRAIIECRRLLLQASADPTIPDDANNNVFFDCVAHGTVDSLRVILDSGKPFISLEERNYVGDTPLTHLAGNYGVLYDARMFGLLLDRGADIHAQNPEGQTCLHIAVKGAFHTETLEREMEAIVLLIQRGADVFSTDKSGRSIFDDAYECDHDMRGFGGGYRGDLWDAVLFQCGYEEHIRKPEERKQHYTKEYTEEHFARLWKGREHLCPYFSNPSGFCPGFGVEDYPFFMDSSGEEDSDEEEACAEEVYGSEGGEDEEDLPGSEEIGDEAYLSNSEQGGSDVGDTGGIPLWEDDC